MGMMDPGALSTASCIVGATRSAQLLENVAAVDFAWDESLEAKVNAILA